MKKRVSAARADSEALWEWNLKSDRIHFSPRWISLAGCEEHEIGNTPDEWMNRVHAEELPDVLRHLAAARAGEGDELEFRHRLRHKDGRYRWTVCRVSVARDGDGAAVRLMGTHADVTVETVTDRLTGLPNRLLLIDRLAHSIERAQKYDGFHYAVLLIDLGGQSSAPLLTAAARRLETSLRIANATPTLRSNDVVARVEGDQFAVLLDGLKAVSHAKVVADRLLKEMLAPFTRNGREVFLSASIGVAVSATGYAQADDVLRDAETALHRARILGGSHCEVFDTGILQSHQAELQLEGDLKDALERREFRLLYQPIVSMASNQIIGFEALVRWHHPVLGVISPVDFIPIAERTELIIPLGEWILREACIRLKTWQDTPSFPPDLWISVNLSGVQLKDATLVQRVGAALSDSGLQSRSLVLELTESMAMENPTGVKSLLMELRSTGVRISIDDFGTGYSSLAHLRQFPVDALKLDRSFVRGIESRQDGAAIVGTLTDMALQLGLHVVAEGIENEQQLALLRSLRCHAAQGYLFARPLDEVKATEILSTGIAPRVTVAKRRKRSTTLASIGKWSQPSVHTWRWAAVVLVALLAAVTLSSLPIAVEQPAVLDLPNAPVPPSAPNPGSRVVARASIPGPATSVQVVPARPVLPEATKNQNPRPQEAEPPSAAIPLTVAASPPVAPATPPAALAPTLPRGDSQSANSTSLSIHVMHYHRVGHCAGQLVATRAGMAFVPDSKTSRDAFDFKYNEFVHIVQDDTLTIKSNTRTFRFKAIIDKADNDPTLDQFEARMKHWR
jgi:EAL domain-containing protein (putative c-di-GMP-specific phosphodiesterase class I)/GGDEF domain-containing protein